MAQEKRKTSNLHGANRGPFSAAILYGRVGLLAKHVQAWAGVLLVMALACGAGCAGAPALAPPEGVEKMEAQELLYQAALSTYERREIPVDVASARFFIITSGFQMVEDDLRKRVVTEVVQAAPGALGLTVTTQWEVRVDEAAAPVWQSLDTPALRERGNAEELVIVREIEQRYNAWKGASAAP